MTTTTLSMRCWYTRWQMSNALDRGELAPRLAHGHAAGCARCQAFGHALGSLHADLARGAHAAPGPAPLARRPRRPLLVAGSLAVGAAAVIALAINMSDAPTPAAPSAPPVAILDPLLRMPGVANRVSQALVNTVLDAELHALIDDSKRGFDAILASGGLREPP